MSIPNFRPHTTPELQSVDSAVAIAPLSPIKGIDTDQQMSSDKYRMYRTSSYVGNSSARSTEALEACVE